MIIKITTLKSVDGRVYENNAGIAVLYLNGVKTKKTKTWGEKTVGTSQQNPIMCYFYHEGGHWSDGVVAIKVPSIFRPGTQMRVVDYGPAVGKGSQGNVHGQGRWQTRTVTADGWVHYGKRWDVNDHCEIYIQPLSEPVESNNNRWYYAEEDQRRYKLMGWGENGVTRKMVLGY